MLIMDDEVVGGFLKSIGRTLVFAFIALLSLFCSGWSFAILALGLAFRCGGFLTFCF